MKGPVLFRKDDKLAKVLKRSSLEPLGQFQPNSAESILGWWKFKYFQGEIIINNEITNSLLQNHLANLNKAPLDEGYNSSFFTNKDHSFLNNEEMFFFSLNTVSQVSDVTYGLLITEFSRCLSPEPHTGSQF